MYPPYQNYYPGYGSQPHYQPPAQRPYYPNGGYGYGSNPPPQPMYNPSAPPQYSNYRGAQSMQPLNLDYALNKASYSSNDRDFILDTILDCFSGRENKVYFQGNSNDKVFIINRTLNVKLNNKSYKVNIIIHLPPQFPNYPPEIYCLKKPKVGINKYYLEQQIIDQSSFRIIIDKICRYNPSKNNLREILDAIQSSFAHNFPIFSDKNSNQIHEIFCKANPDFKRMNEVIVKSEKITDKQVEDLVRNQAKECVKNKLNSFNSKYNIDKNYKELKTINDITKLNAGNSLNGNEHPMNESLNVLKGIKQQLADIENGLNKEIQYSSSQNKTTLEKCEELIKVNDGEDMKFVIMKKTIEDYLAYLKKGYEKKLVSFDEILSQTRALSREIFSIDYLRKQRKLYN